MSPTHEQSRTLVCIREWMQIRSEAGHSLPRTALEFWDDVQNSALLRRLLDGKDPLQKPPPLSYGQPWYELGERGFAQCDVESQDGRLLINGTGWEIVDGSREDEYVVRVPGDAETYLVWKVASISAISPQNTSGWIIENAGSTP